ncbi:hypothetical protein EXS62_00240 [Candidatus Kaiserbacteria bacterium]|nr:hypothetical protein [Candidatus Kaiserbacteria bacterium]
MKKRIVSKKTAKKIKSAGKSVAKKTGSFVRKANKEVGKTARALQKEWKREQPQREEYIRNFKKIGGDVIETIKKDVREIRNNKTKGKNKKK